MKDTETVTTLVNLYRQLKAKQELFGERMAGVKEALAPYIEEGDGFSDEAGYARLIVPRQETVSYDVKALDNLRAASPDLNKLLTPFRTVKAPGKPYIQIK